jgi:hypothetical protein
MALKSLSVSLYEREKLTVSPSFKGGLRGISLGDKRKEGLSPLFDAP